MHVKLLTLRYSPSLGAFDDTPLQELMRDKEVLDFREHFFSVSDVPHVLCVVTWQRAVERDGGGAPSGDRPDPRAQLSERERALFETLRSWRAGALRHPDEQAARGGGEGATGERHCAGARA